MTGKDRFDWHRHAAAERLCLDALSVALKQSAFLAGLENRLRAEASGRLLDWIDHLRLIDSSALQERLSSCGYTQEPDNGGSWYHPGALLPRFVLGGSSSKVEVGVALRVENIADFLQVHALNTEIEGDPMGSFRRSRICSEGKVEIWAVERRGSRSYDPATSSEDYLRKYFEALESWQCRPRATDDDLEDTLSRAGQLAADLGPDLAAHIVCQGERQYWLSRNFAGRLQKSRQDALGLGWANQDHHTFRSSRRNFSRLVELFSRMGFHCRERFYAGEEAGWGAQVMENSAAGLTLFLDVDLAPDEIAGDFSCEPLPEREELGTVGLWCALHGDSILEAGMHHLAAQFDFARLMRDLAEHGVSYMAPFSDFTYLKQAFSLAERWQVAGERLSILAREKRISAEQEDRFLTQGALGSHLEDIHRGEGYKGFNKKNVSSIIRETDPRK